MDNSSPILKSSVLLYKIGKKIHFQTSGYTYSIDDETGVTADLISQMDGSTQYREIKHKLLKKYKELTESKLDEIMQCLDDACFLEDTIKLPPAELSDNDLVRWSRNFDFYGSFYKMNDNKYLPQVNISKCKIALIGVGGLGSHILYDLAALGAQDIKALDYDKVELSNLNRQILYTEDDIGKDKIWAAERKIKKFNPQIKTEFFNKKITSSEDFDEIINDRDIVICVADKPKMKIIKWLNEACTKYNIPFISGGLNTQQAVYYSVIPGDSGCTDCWKNCVEISDEFSKELLEKEKEMDENDPSNVPAAAIVPFVSIITGLMIAEFIRIVTGVCQPVATNKLLSIDFKTMKIEEIENWHRIGNCPSCGHLSKTDKVA